MAPRTHDIFRRTRTRWLTAVSLIVAVVAPASEARVAQTGAPSGTRPELVVQMGHRAGLGGGVQLLALSADGRWLASGSGVFDNTIHLWDTSTWVQARVIPAVGSVEGLAFHPQGRLLAAFSRGPSDTVAKDVSVWDSFTGRRVHNWHLAAGAFGAETLHFGFSDDGKRLGLVRVPAREANEEARMWDVAAGREVQGDTRWCHSLPEPKSDALIDGGRLRVSGSEGNSAITIKDARGRVLREAGGDVTLGESLAFSSDGRWLAIGGGVTYQNGDSAVRLLDLRTGELARRVSSGVYGMDKLSFSADGRRLAFVAHGTGPSRSSVYVQESAGAGSVAAHEGRVRTFALHPQGEWLVFNEEGGGNPRLQIWRFTAEEAPAEWAGSGVYSHMEFSPDGRWLFCGSLSSYRGLSIWNASTRQLEKNVDRAAQGIAVSPDSRLLAIANDQELAVVETGSWKTMYSLPVGEGKLVLDAKGAGTRLALRFSADGKILAALGKDNIILLDSATGRVLQDVTGHTDEVMDVAFSPDGRSMASTSRDGSVRLWETRTWKEVALLAMMRETNDWLVATPDGLFDGSMAALRSLVAWRFANNQTAPLELFFNEYYHPGLLAEVLKGKALQAPRDLAQLDRRQPDVRLSLVDEPSGSGAAPVRDRRVRVEVAEAPADAANRTGGSGARDVRLFRNGSLVKVWRGDVLQGKTGPATLDATVPLVAGDNRLTAYAFNRDNIKSADANLLVTGASSLKRSGTAYILAIGVNQYANPDYNLRFSVPDAEVFAEEMRRQQTSLAIFGQIEVATLLDKDATRANILHGIARLAGQESGPPSAGEPAALAKLKPAQPEDAVFVFFAGHGTAAGPRFYLIPHDVGYTGGRNAVDAAALKTILAHSISDVDLEQAFEKVDAGRLLLVIDACNSGQALEAEEKRRGPMNSKGLAQLAYEKGMYVLAAAQGYQAALEVTELGHGLLTYVLVEEGLKSSAADTTPKDGQVALREWLDYVALRVPLMQQSAMLAARKVGRQVAFVEGEATIQDVDRRSLQRPRVFYRREAEPAPLVVARPPVK